MQPTADTTPARAAAADTDGPTDTAPRPDLTDYNRQHLELAPTQRTGRLRLQAMAPDGDGGQTFRVRALSRDTIQAQVREPAPEYSAIARKTRESAGTHARNGVTRSG